MIHLSILIFAPLVLGLLSAFTPRILVLATLVPLVYAIMLVADFDTAGGLQHVTDDAWISELGIRYKLGVDGLNLWLVLLTAVVAFASSIWLAVRPPERAGLFAFHMGLGETAVLGAFLAQDLALFVLFFDLMLVPFYFLVGQWGGDGPGAGGDEDGHLHARRLAADARGARWPPRCSRPSATGRSRSCSPTCRPTRCRRPRRSGSSSRSRSRS